MIIKIAWRNIWRHKTRSAVIIVSIIFGTWAGLFIQAYLNGMVEDRIRIAIEKEISHIQIHSSQFQKDYDVNFIIPDGQEIITTISSFPEVKSASGRVITRGMIATANGSSGVKISGVDPVKESSTTHLETNIIEGTYFTSSAVNELVIGEKLITKLKLKLKSKVVLTFMDKENNIVSGAFRICGIFRTKNTPFDESNIFIKKQDLAELTSTGNELHEIAILLHSNNTLDQVMSKLRTKYPFLKIENWRELAPEMDLVVSTTNQSMYIYMGIIMLALAFGIINTMLMAILERTREIGMLMALGLTRTNVFKMIFFETVFLVFSGTPPGIFLAWLTTFYFGRIGIDMSVYKEVYASFGYSDVIYPVLNFRDYRIILELVISTTIVSSLFPARRAISLNPADAIRK